MYVRPISTRLFSGMLTQALRAPTDLPLPLLVPRVLADHQDAAVPADDLALLTHRLDRRSYLHGPFRLDNPDGKGAGDACSRPYHPPGNGGGTPEPRSSRARPSRIAKGYWRPRCRCAAVSPSLGGFGRSVDGQLGPLAPAQPEP